MMPPRGPAQQRTANWSVIANAPYARNIGELKMWDATKRIHPDEMPPPDALINYPDGSTGTAMFHYLAAEDHEAFENVLREHGFDVKGYHMDDDHPLMAEYAEGSEKVIGKWDVKVPDGWALGGKHDTEDGPYVFFIRPKQAEAA
jgi:hypothetical protein